MKRRKSSKDHENEIEDTQFALIRYQSKKEKKVFDEEQYIRKRNISMIKYKEKKKLQKKSLL